MADGVQETFVPPGSSTIGSFTYTPDTEELVVEFKDGSTYTYSGVDPATVRRWQQSGGSGKFFYANIRTRFAYNLS